MKNITIFVLAFVCLSFCPSAEKLEKEEIAFRSGFHITVNDFTTRKFHEYIVESRDSVNIIFTNFFNSELDLGEVNRPISIYNGEHDFYIARVNVYDKANGKVSFKNLKYPPVYKNANKEDKRKKRKPVFEVF